MSGKTIHKGTSSQTQTHAWVFFETTLHSSLGNQGSAQYTPFSKQGNREAKHKNNKNFSQIKPY